MCRTVRCRTCSKTTWSGCGGHINQVRATVPDDQWCPGHPKAQKSTGSTPWLRRILGRSGDSR